MRNETRFWIKHPWYVVFVWLSLSLALGIGGLCLGERTVLPGPWAKETLLRNEGERRAYERGFPPKDTLLITLTHQQLTASSPVFTAARESLVAALKSLKSTEPAASGSRLFSRVQTSGNTMLDESVFISADDRAVLIKADTTDSVDVTAKVMHDIPEFFQHWEGEHPGFSLAYLSNGTADGEVFSLINRDLDNSLIYTLPLTLLVLFWAFGSVVAALVPMVMALVSLFAALGASAFFSHLAGPISATASQLVVLLVLAVGIDYSLFIISRVREELRAGESHQVAVTVARSRTGIAVLWSGLTVCLSLVGLFLMQDSVLMSMALVAILAVAITVISCTFILPSVLILLDRRLEWGRLGNKTLPGVSPGSSPELADGAMHPSLRRWISLSVNHPVKTLLFSGLLLLGLAAFSRELRLGSTIDPQIMPESLQSTRAFAVIEKFFPKLAGGDFSIVMFSPNLDELEDSGTIQPFFDRVLENERVTGPIGIDRSADLKGARFKYLLRGSWNDPANQAFIDQLRDHLVPELLGPLGVQASLSGTLPYVVDETERYIGRTPAVFGVVLLLSVIFLLVAFRSLVVPIKAVLLNGLSTAASFGVLVLVFQHGYRSTGSSIAGSRITGNFGVIEGFVPALLFAILFGLSMDYHVFLLSRVSEEFRKGKSCADAVKDGIIATAGSITSAALIMVSVFAVVASLELPIMRQLGVGLAVAVFLDATIIRSLLLPASMVLLGSWNWYLPRCLRWLPKLELE